MKIRVINVTDLPDGGAKLDVEADDEFTAKAVEFYLTHILTLALDENNKEYQIVETPSAE